MTAAEERFYTSVPRRLNAIENHLEKIATCLEKLTDIVAKMYDGEEE